VFWAREFRTLRRLEFRARSVSNATDAFAAAAPLVSTVALFATLTLFPREGLSLGAFLAFNVAFVRLLSSALSMSSTIGSLIEIVTVYERSRPILDALPEASTAKTVPADLRGDIELSHVSFRYQPDAPLVLDDVSLRIRPGQFVAFVGPSGAGKSTILRLLLGFEKPTSGAIFYDGEDLAELDLQALRRQAGVVLQQARLLPGTVLENIIGSSLLTENDAWEVARLTGLDGDIRQMSQGMHTVLAEGGSTLSGGQRQRLMITRAIAARPRMLFFDEATSAQDNVTQAQVSRGLDALKATRVVVAHRLSTIRNADHIYVLDAGRIAEEGTYDELLRKDGLFAGLVKRQLA
jgi:ABC-type bacteriocin/lantibiotic exporter with double-glycine peptidase domain